MLRRAAAGALEAAVLSALWDSRDWCTPAEVQERLGPDHPVTYTTAMTVLVRLWKKGAVERHKSGRAFAYRAIQTREEHLAGRMGRLLDAASDRRGALSHFVATLDEGEQAELKRLLAKRRSSR